MDNIFDIFSELQNILLSIQNRNDIDKVYDYIVTKKLFYEFSMSETTLKMITAVVCSHPKLIMSAIYLLQKIQKNLLPKLFPHFQYPYLNYRKYHYPDNFVCYYSLLGILSNLFYKSFLFAFLDEWTIKIIVTYLKFYNKISIYNALINDDIEYLQSIRSKKNIDLSELFNFPFCVKDKFIESATLLQYSAFFGSIKCFKYLIMNTANINFKKLLEYSIAGGNMDIIHITEMQSDDNTITQNKELLKIAIKYMQNDLIEYIVECYGIEITHENFEDCYYSFNLSAFPILMELVCAYQTDEKEMNYILCDYISCTREYLKNFRQWEADYFQLMDYCFFDDDLYYDIPINITEFWCDDYKNLEDDKNYISIRRFKSKKFDHDKHKCHHSIMKKQIKKITQKKKRKSRNKILRYDINEVFS